jgi:RES domain-containing protein
MIWARSETNSKVTSRVTAWHIVAEGSEDPELGGLSANLDGGRWNSCGVRVVYLASSLALAALELLAHLDREQALREYRAIPVEFGEHALRRLDRDRLPPGWDARDAGGATKALGDAWVLGRESPLLQVPSCVVRPEPNYLFNPDHPDAYRVRIGRPQPFRFDLRLLES